MPYLRCTDEECGHEWFERSHLAEGSDCVECGSPSELVGRDEEIDERVEPRPRTAAAVRPRKEHARKAARAVLKSLGAYAPPTPVEHLAAVNGLTIVESDSLPTTIRARLVNRTIELARDDAPVAKRFSIAHELGHHRMGSVHGAVQQYEIEADHFASELLVPQQALVAAVKELHDVMELATLFQVSRQVIEIALDQHGVAL